jgi:hypothetical protein
VSDEESEHAMAANETGLRFSESDGPILEPLTESESAMALYGISQ